MRPEVKPEVESLQPEMTGPDIANGAAALEAKPEVGRTRPEQSRPRPETRPYPVFKTRLGPKERLAVAALVALGFSALYLFVDLPGDWRFALERRLLKVISVVLVGSSIAFSTVVFQTMTNNRILTPSIIGMDSLYGLLQTLIVFTLGATHPLWTNPRVHFAVSAALMIGLATLLYQALFRKAGHNLYFVLLFGIILGSFFGSIGSFMEKIMDPNEFLVAQGRMFGSFNSVRQELLLIAGVGNGAIGLWSFPLWRYLDAMALGRDHAINLGVDYNRVVRRLWMVIAGLVSVSTALVGPVTFLGLLVANLAYQLFTTHRHTILIPGAAALGVAALVAAMFAVERVFSFTTTVSVVINFVGSLYFLYIVLKESQR